MLALEWLKNAHGIMEKLEATQLENIKIFAQELIIGLIILGSRVSGTCWNDNFYCCVKVSSLW